MARKELKIKADFPPKTRFLFRPYDYKVLRGGRGSAKSWSVARALLVLGARRPLRILCAREIQDSIRQSVHQLLKDQIKLMGFGSFYNVVATEIRGKNGTLFSFTGLSTHTVDTIKSFEGIDICWIEEGQTITHRSWRILLPTIRKDGSEVWVTYNPDLETDPTHQIFTINPMPGTMNVEMNWRDNPYWNEKLESQRLHCLATDPDNYDNIWEGKCRPAVEGAIFYKQIESAQNDNRICPVPYDPMLKVHMVYDLGWEDSIGCSLIQKATSEVRIIEYLEAHHTDLDAFSDELRMRGYNWGRVWLPHDGFAKQLNSKGKSSADILEALGWNVATKEEITEVSKEEGIRQARLEFHRFYFDQTKAAAETAMDALTNRFNATPLNGRIVEALKRYRRAMNQKTGAPGGTVRDEYAHGGDNIRYVALNCDNMTNEGVSSISFEVNKGFRSGVGRIMGQVSGWMAA